MLPLMRAPDSQHRGDRATGRDDACDHVVVVGGGVLGLCTAYYAAREGRRVTLVERGEAGGDNCSMGNAGMIVPSHFVPLAAPGMIAKGLRWMFDRESPFYIRPRPSLDLARWGWLFFRHANERHVAASRELLRDLNLESRRLFRELAEDTDFGLREHGLLMLCDTAEGLDAEAAVAAQAAAIGVEARVVDPAEAARLDPGIRMRVAGAVFYPQDCHLDPAAFMRTMRQRLAGLGVDLVHGAEIDRIHRSRDGRVTRLAAGGRAFDGDRFVFTGGAWTARLLKKLGFSLPLQAGKGYSLTLANPPELPRLCSIFSEAKVAITPIANRLRFAGTMEIGGENFTVDPARVRGIVKSVGRYFPAFEPRDFDDVEPWVGLRPVSPDGIPYIGPVPGAANAFAASGHAMMGLSLGPVTGRLLADLVTARPSFRSLAALAPGRFG